MMQFSLPPTRVLDDDHLNATLAAVALHQQLVPEIRALAKTAAQSGEPILRPMAYHYDHVDEVVDQFLSGKNILAAPVLEEVQRFAGYCCRPAPGWIRTSEDTPAQQGSASR